MDCLEGDTLPAGRGLGYGCMETWPAWRAGITGRRGSGSHRGAGSWRSYSYIPLHLDKKHTGLANCFLQHIFIWFEFSLRLNQTFLLSLLLLLILLVNYFLIYFLISWLSSHMSYLDKHAPTLPHQDSHATTEHVQHATTIMVHTDWHAVTDYNMENIY